MIRVHELRKIYKVHKKEPGLKGSLKALFYREKSEKEALKGVSLEIQEGEIVGLIGSNGAGKTTLVKSLAGIIYPTSGSIDIMGYTPQDRKSEFRRMIALIMGQKAQLWWDLPAADSFLLLKEIYRIPDDLFRKNLDYLTEVLDAGRLLKIPVRRLSLGERMKMELVAALLHQPKVVFLDEPTIGLDITAQREIRRFILNYREQMNPVMLLTSHYMEDIERLCKRIIVLREGEIVYDGSLGKVISDYAAHKVLTARFDGSAGGNPSAEDSGLSAESFFPRELGSVVTLNDDFIKVQVRKDRIPDGVRFILEKFNIMDVNIEEEDIGTIIESIMRKEKQPE